MIAVTFALPIESRDFVPPRDVVVAHTGVGEQRARKSIERLLREGSYEAIISAGFAGALNDELEIGSVFAAENFSDAALLEHVSLPRVQLTTASTVADSAAERAQLARATGAAAVDMETKWIADACRSTGVPLLAVRVITDSPSRPLPAPAAVLFDVERQRTNPLALASYVVRHPATIPRLLRFSRQIARARTNLTAALLSVIRKIS